MKVSYRFGDVYLVKFERSVGAEIRKTRPAVVLFPKKVDEKSRTVFVVAPMSTGGRGIPEWLKVKTRFNGRNGYILLGRMDSVDKSRMIKYLGRLSDDEAERLAVSFVDVANRLFLGR